MSEHPKSTPSGPFCVKPYCRALRYADQHVPPVGHGQLVRQQTPAALAPLEVFVRDLAVLLRAFDLTVRQAARELAPALRILDAAAHNWARALSVAQRPPARK